MVSRMVIAGLVWLSAATWCAGQAVTLIDSEEAVPQWIWRAAEAHDDETVYFYQAFVLESGRRSASLTGACDNEMDVYLNGHHVAGSMDWKQPVAVDVTRTLRRGKNVLMVKARNVDGPAGLLLKLEVQLTDQRRLAVVTDGRWRVSSQAEDWKHPHFEPTDWQPAHVLGPLGMLPWGELPPGRGGVPSYATPVEDMRTLPGFEVELLYSVPRESQGSWVSLAVDPHNRFYVGDQEGGLFRVTVGAQASDTSVEALQTSLNAVHGLLWAFESLYAMVGMGPQAGLWRLRDTTGDDRFDHVEQLLALHGGGEHGPHTLVQGPDDLLYLVAGNFTPIPENLTPDSPLRNWDEDLLLPRIPDGHNYATGIMAPGGWVIATDETGSFWRLIAGGIRNAYDLAFNAEGELFTFDSDMERDIGTPWYRPTRICHVVSGAEFGWRYGSGKWPAYYPDSVGPVVDAGLGSPTGMVFGHAARFPAKYQQALFVQDWTYGRILAVHLEPQGATYTGTFEVFLEGKPLPLTRMVIGRDGAMYFITGGRRLQSGLYRVTYKGDEATQPIVSRDEADSPHAQARALRRQLEAFHGRQDAAAIDFAWPHLNSNDRAIRYAARVAIEHQDAELWWRKALAETRTEASIAALLALARDGNPGLQRPLLASLDRLPLDRLTERQTLDALRVYALAFIRMGEPNESTRAALVHKFDAMLPTRSELINRELTQLLVYLQSPAVVAKALALLETARTQEEYVFYLFVLRTLEEGWTMELRERYFRWINAATTRFRGGASFANFILRIKGDAIETLTPEQREALEPILRDPVHQPQRELAQPRQFVHNWQEQDLLPHLDETRQGRSFERGREAFSAAGCIDCIALTAWGAARGRI